jgi:hypothetical protein
MRDDKAHAHAHAAMRGDTACAAHNAVEQPRQAARSARHSAASGGARQCAAGRTRAVANKEDVVGRVKQLQRAWRRVRRCRRVCGENSMKKTCDAAAP